MSNNEQELSETDKQKDVAFYSSCVNAWIQTRMEKDKQLLTLSSVAMGFLINLYKDLGNDTTAFVLWLGSTLI